MSDLQLRSQTSVSDTTFRSPLSSPKGEWHNWIVGSELQGKSPAIPSCTSTSPSHQQRAIHRSIKSGGFISLYLKLDSHGRCCLGHTVVDQPLSICGKSREVQYKEDYDDLLIHCLGTGQQAMALLCWNGQQWKILQCCSTALTWEAKLFGWSYVNEGMRWRASVLLVLLISSSLASFHDRSITSSSQFDLLLSFLQLLHLLLSPIISTSKHWQRNAGTTLSGRDDHSDPPTIWTLSCFLWSCPFCVEAVLHWVCLRGWTANGLKRPRKTWNLLGVTELWWVLQVLQHLELIQRAHAPSDSTGFPVHGAGPLQCCKSAFLCYTYTSQD